MVSFDDRQLEQIRASSDLREGRVRAFVQAQLTHADPGVSAAAQQVLDGDLAVWQLVDMVQEVNEMEQTFHAVHDLIQAMDPADRLALRQEAGVDAQALRELAAPDPGQPSGEAAYYLDQLGARDGASVEQVKEFFGVDVFGMFHVDALEEHLREVPSKGDDARGGHQRR